MKNFKNFPTLITTSLLLSAACFTFALEVRAQPQIDIQDRIATQRFLVDTYDTLFGKKEYKTAKNLFLQFKNLPSTEQQRAKQLMRSLDASFPEKSLIPLLYWRLVEKDPKRVAEVLAHTMVLRVNTLRDVADDPSVTNAAEKARALRYLRNLAGGREISTLDAFNSTIDQIQQDAETIAASESDAAFLAGILSNNFLSGDYNNFPAYSLAATGFIPGNKVELISHNETNMDRINWLNERVIFGGNKLDFSKPYMRMPTADGEGGHIIFAQDPIYKRIREMIDSAQDSIFINIFLYGGTLGGTLSKYLIDQTLEKAKKNPNFKTIFLHDYATNYNMKEEMMPVFEYMLSRIQQEPEVAKHFMLMQANIQRHPPGIPFGLSNLIPKTDEVFKEVEKMNTYYESKIDHSKVIVVDANTDAPKAYFGSKNWTDHSGGYYYDNALYVEGPAAALVQAAYYDDIEAALTLDPKERKWFFFKEQGFDNERYLSSRKSILDWFRVKKDSYPAVGEQSVRLAEANVDGRIKDVRNMIIDQIAKAKKSIYMEQLFMYDPYINDALLKKKLMNPKMDIKVMVDHNGNFGMNGLPNTINLKELIKHGIEIRARKTVGVSTTLPNGETRHYHQENHRKISSFDSKVMMIGSSNLNPDTLQGSFREFGAEIYDPKEIQKFESYFLADWSNTELTMELDMERLQLKLLGKKLSVEASALLNDIAAQLLRSKDSLENRY